MDESFEIVKRRNENGSIIITANRSFEDLANVLVTRYLHQPQ